MEAFPDAQAQLDILVAELRETFAERLQAVLLHGSLAMSGFDPQRSDLDVLVIVQRPPTEAQLEQLGRCLLEISGSPHPLELSVLLASDLLSWQHPCPHLFHYGESHRAEFAQGRTSPPQMSDPDLAMHLTVARRRGVDLLGNWPPSKLPEIPAADFLAAIREDFRWSADQAEDLQDYRLANACRTLAYLEHGLVLSKSEGLAWCLRSGIEPAAALATVLDRLEVGVPGREPST